MGISFAQLRDLDTTKLSNAADAAVSVGKDMETRAGDVADAAKNGTGGGFWAGADAEAQNALLNTFPPPLNAAGSVFKFSGGTIDTLVTELTGAKEDIARAISSYPELKVGDDGSVSWPPTTDPGENQLLANRAQALSGLLKAAVERANTADEAASSQLSANDLGSGKPVEVKLPDGSVYLATGDDDNDVKVTNDADGNVVVNVDGEEYKYAPGTNVALNTGGGEDEVDIDKSTDNGVIANTGDGKDTVTDHESKGPRTFVTGEGEDTVATTGDDRNVFTEGGNDTVRAIGNGNNLASGAGDDAIETTGGKVFGGDGNDEIRAGDHDNPFFDDRPENATDIYGGAGNDKITGSGQDDTIVGGGGNDDITGKGGNDRISGNTGDDTIDSGNGDDLVAAGDGNDTVDTGEGNDGIDGGDGDDTIEARSGDDKVFGGAGEDELYGHDGNDTIAGGDDHDYIDGQNGDDTLSGGDDNDVVYGLDGNDTLDGGQGRDYLEGGRDNDTLTGGTENDVLSGGRGDDRLSGQDGDDVMYAGEGADALDGGAGADKNFVQDGDTTTADKADKVEKVDIVDNGFIKVEGSEDFQDRIHADLDMYSSSPTGRQLIENLADNVSDTHDDWAPGEREVVINEFDEDNGTAGTGVGSWSDVNININPEYDGSAAQHQATPTGPYEKVPAHTLYHELGHAYDYLNDTSIDGDYSDGTPNSERQATGLPTVDHDDDPSTPDVIDPDHPKQYTENGLREEMGRDERPSY